jgi:arsenite methyltransferase
MSGGPASLGRRVIQTFPISPRHSIDNSIRDSEHAAKLAAADFQNIDIEPTRYFRTAGARVLKEQGVHVDAPAAEADGKFRSAFIRASKPVR